MGFPKAQYWGPFFSTCTSMICLQSVQLAMSSLMWMTPSYTFPSPVKKSKVAWKISRLIYYALHLGSSKMLGQVTIPPLTLMGKDLHVVDSVKDLGVILDKRLSFNEHVDTLVSNLMGKLCMISRVRHVLDTPTLFTVINSLVFSSLFYCSSVWSGTCKGNIAKLQLVQNFAARLLSGKRKFDHITPTLKQLKLLPVSDPLYIRDAVQMYKCMNNLASSYLSQLFTKRSQTHSFLTKKRDSLQLPRCRTALAQQSFVFRGVTIWNSLPEELRNCSSIVSFKNQLKSELLSKWLND